MKKFVTPWKHGTKERGALEEYCKPRKLSLEDGVDRLITSALIRSGDLTPTESHKKRGLTE